MSTSIKNAIVTHLRQNLIEQAETLHKKGQCSAKKVYEIRLGLYDDVIANSHGRPKDDLIADIFEKDVIKL